MSIEDAPADAKAVGDQLNDVKADLTQILSQDIIDSSLLERGTITDGSNTSNTKRVRSITYLSKDYIKLSALNDFYITLVFWDDNGYAGYLSSSKTVITSGAGEYFDKIDLSVYKDYKYRLIVRKGSGSAAITVNDVYENITVTRSIVDSSLTISGKAADAKAVGDKVGELKEYTDTLSSDIHPIGNASIDDLLENGSFTDGEKTSSAIRVRTEDFIPANSNLITVDSSILVHAVAWDNDGYVGYLKSDGTFAPTGTGAYVSELNFAKIFSEHEDYKIALIFRKSSGLYNSISPSDVIGHYVLTEFKNAFSEISTLSQELQVVEKKS